MMKTILSFLLGLFLCGSLHAQTINNLGAGSAVSSTDMFPSYQGANPATGVTAAQLRTFMGVVNAGSPTFNTFAGLLVVPSITSATGSTGFGYNALHALTSGNSNTAYGYNAVDSVSTGTFNVGFGDNAGRCISTGTGNDAIGHGSLGQDDTTPANCTGNYNAGLGNWTLQELTTGGGNTAVGVSAMTNATTDNNNVAVGFAALTGGSTTDSTGISVGSQNVAVGYQSMFNNTASNQTAIGYFSMHANTTGTLSTAVGFQALQSSVADVRNTALGYNALATLNGNPDNTAVGASSLTAATTANANTALGSHSGVVLTSGVKNLLLGQYVGNATLTTGSRNILIGTDTNCDTAASGTNDTFAVCASSGSTNLISGNRVSGSLSVTMGGTLTVAGIASTAQADVVCTTSAGLLTYQVSATGCAASSERFKQDIHPISDEQGLQVVAMLEPKTYHYRPETNMGDDVHFGFTAEQVEKVDPDLITYEQDGKPHAVKYNELWPFLTAAIKELKSENDNLRACNADWKCRLFGWR